MAWNASSVGSKSGLWQILIVGDISRNQLFQPSWQHILLHFVSYSMVVIPSRKSLALCDRLSVSSFYRRRFATVMVQLKFADHLKEAMTYIEEGRIRVGPDTITDPAFPCVTRNMEDFITWVDTSKIRRKVLEYNEKLDDFDAMN